MKFIKNKSGVSIIATVLALLMLSLFAAVIVTLITTGSGVSVQEVQGMQAFSIAEGGLERALGGFKWTGTACALLTYNNIPLGLGSFSTTGTLYNPSPSTTLTANIFIGTLTIPAVSTAGYAPYGRIRIDSEEIDYSYISGNNFIVAKRGANGTIEANHSFGASVIQNQCLIRSTGTITNPFGNIQRVVEKAVAIVPSAAFLDGGSVAIGTTETNIGSLSTTFPSGNNLIIVAVSLRKNTAPSRDIALGNLRLRRGGTTLASNQSLIRVGGGAAPSATNFPQETQFLLYRDVGVGPYPTYDVTAIASGAGISGEVKMIVINNAPSSSFQDGGNVGIVTVAAGTTILTHNSTVPAGNNVIIAAVQLDNTAGATRTISAGNLELRRGVTTLSENQFAINLARSGRVNRGTGVLLIARDAGAPANPTYTIWGRATGGGGIMGEAKIIVLNGLLSAFLD
ncbi:MAG: hypothetical protein HZC12_07365, partial [Nitrospirae bacterium]|nr:hypothetical protein [Nitrospirota bacterium]